MVDQTLFSSESPNTAVLIVRWRAVIAYISETTLFYRVYERIDIFSMLPLCCFTWELPYVDDR